MHWEIEILPLITYDEATANEILLKIRNSYFPLLKQLQGWMQSKTEL